MKSLGITALLQDCDVLKARFPVGTDIRGDDKEIGKRITPRHSVIAKFWLQNSGRGSRDASRAC